MIPLFQHLLYHHYLFGKALNLSETIFCYYQENQEYRQHYLNLFLLFSIAINIQMLLASSTCAFFISLNAISKWSTDFKYYFLSALFATASAAILFGTVIVSLKFMYTLL